MSTHSMNDATVSRHTPSSEVTGSVGRGVLIGLIPLGLLIVLVTVTVLLTTLARLLLASAGFFVQQQAAVIVLIVGLILTIAVFAVAIWRVLRQVAVWQQDGVIVQANATLWALGVTALVVVVPVLLALLLPQHPAP
jgi:ABC-type nickel/cobalt efflux system permease component RcnA